MNLKIRFQLSGMMFLEYFIWGTWYVVMSTYLGLTLKFDGLQIGSVYSTVSIAAMISPFFVGLIADRFFATERVLAFLHLVGAVLLYLISQAEEFSLFFPLMLGYTLCYMPTIALTNSLAFSQMDNPGEQFPGVRVLGTVSWIIVNNLISLLGLEDQSTPFLIGSAASGAMALYCLTLPHTPPKAKGKDVSISEILGLEALSLLKSPSFLVFFIASLLICIPLTFYYNFANLFLNELGLENAGSKMTLGQVSETLFLLIMPFFFARLGVKWMLAVAMISWGLRYILFAYGNVDAGVWMLYAGIILHGICYDFFFVTGQIYTDNKAGEKVKNAAQGLITFATYGLGMFMGSYVSGWVVNHYTQQQGDTAVHDWTSIWLVPGIGSFVILIIFLAVFRERSSTSK